MYVSRLGTAPLRLVAAAIQMALGLAIFELPYEFGAPTYDLIRPYFPYLAVSLMAAGVVLLHWRGALPSPWRQLQAVSAAAPLVVLTVWMVWEAGWTGVLLYGVVALALLVSAWWPEHLDGRHGPSLLSWTGVVIFGLTGAVMLFWPGAFGIDLYRPIVPVLPLGGLAGFAGAAALLLPAAERWPLAWLQRLLPAALPALLAANWALGGYWSGVVSWGTLAIALLVGERALIRRLDQADRRAEAAAVDEDTGESLAAHEHTLERWTWLLAVLVAAVMALGGDAAFDRPAAAHLFVLAITAYNVIVHGLLPGLGTPAHRVTSHLIYLTLLGGLLHISAGPAGHGYLTLLVAVPPRATQAFGLAAGRRFLWLAVGVVVVSEIAGWWLSGRAETVVFGAATVLQVVLLLAAATVGMNSAQASRDKHRQLAAALETVRESEGERARLVSILEAMPDGVGMSDTEGNALYVNPAGRRLFGLPETGPLLDHKVAINHPEWAHRQVVEEGRPAAARDGFWRGETAIVTRDGREIPVLQTVIAHRDSFGQIAYFSTVIRDISAQKSLEATLRHMALHDPLTGLANRRKFQQELSRLLGDAVQARQPLSLLLLDLDEFKQFNDTYGHGAGDRFLSSLAVLMQQQTPGDGVAARLGGDEFALVLPNTDLEAAQAIAQALLDSFRRYRLGESGGPVNGTVSIGVASYPDHGQTADTLLSRADMALYRAKAKGRNMFAVCPSDGSWQQQAESQRDWDERIRKALNNDRFVLMCQPIKNARTGQTCQYELLLRMVGEKGELIAPGAFIGPAEHLGHIHDIDRWVVRQAIHMLARTAAGPTGAVRLAVNLSAKAFGDAGLIPLIEDEFRRTGADPKRLTLEITETAAVADIGEACRFIERLRQLGCQFAIDDFGTGFSSYTLLRRLPVQVIKIDRSLIRNLASDEADREFVRAMITIAHSLGQEVIAEGIEDEGTLALVQSLAADYVQGYYLGRPLPIEACAEQSASGRSEVATVWPQHSV